MSADEVATILGANPLFADAKATRARRVAARVEAARVPDALRVVRDELGGRHLSMLHGADTGRVLEAHYHVSLPDGVVVSLRAELPREHPRLPSATSVYPSAVLFERETMDLYGIAFEGHPDPRRLLLADSWPADEHPLRKDWKGGEPHA